MAIEKNFHLSDVYVDGMLATNNTACVTLFLNNQSAHETILARQRYGKGQVLDVNYAYSIVNKTRPKTKHF